MQRQPDLKEGWWKLAEVYRLQQSPELVLMALTRLLEADPDDARALWERADQHYQSKQLADAMGDLHKLLALDPGHQKARQFKALILEKLDGEGWS